jgi:serine/threonine protein kinase
MPDHKQFNQLVQLPQKASLPAGTMIRGRRNQTYIVEGVLGQGGFSSVYLVRDQSTEPQHFALKEVSLPAIQEQCNLIFEAEVLMRLHHRSLPHIYEVFADPTNHRAYLLMDYIAGKDLETLRAEQAQKRYSLILVIILMNPIVEAISYLHAQMPPIIHRDIKPANIIVPDTGQDAFLVDFGLAKEYVKGKTTSIFRGGTPGYAAPEQYSQGTGPQTDVYGLAATLYTLLTGTVLPAAIIRSCHKHEDEALKRVSQLNPTIPTAIDDILTRALSLQVEQRYASIDDFWQEFTMAAEIHAMGGKQIATPAPQCVVTPAPLQVQPTTPFPAQPITPFATRTAITATNAQKPSVFRSSRTAWLIITWSTLILVLFSIATGSFFWVLSQSLHAPAVSPDRHRADLALTNSCLASHQQNARITDQQAIPCPSPDDPTATSTTPTTPIPATSNPAPTTIYATPIPANTPAALANHTPAAYPAPATPTPSPSLTAMPTATPNSPDPSPTEIANTPAPTPTPAPATPTPTPSSQERTMPIISINLPLLP